MLEQRHACNCCFEILELTSVFDDIMSAPREGHVQAAHFNDVGLLAEHEAVRNTAGVVSTPVRPATRLRALGTVVGNLARERERFMRSS